jgi:hypothetical protein
LLRDCEHFAADVWERYSFRGEAMSIGTGNHHGSYRAL